MEEVEAPTIQPVEKKKKKKSIWIILLIGLAIFYFSTGLFVIQPMGLAPEGVTIWYFRLGTNMPFISSADGLALKANGGVSLMTRMAAMGSFVNNFEDKIIARLGYSRTLYGISTGGVYFED